MPSGVKIDSMVTAVVEDGVPFLLLRIGDCVFDISGASGIMSDVIVQDAVDLARSVQEVSEEGGAG